MAKDFGNSPSVGDIEELVGGLISQATETSPVAVFEKIGGALGPGIVVQTFTSSGTYTPSPGMRYAILGCRGNGGGGGGVGDGTGEDNAAGGGGEGALALACVTAADVGASQTVTIPPAASGGTAGADGSAGGDVSIGSLCVADGGLGGGYADYSVGGAAGGGLGGTISNSTGDLVFPGNAGGSGSKANTTAIIHPSGAGGGSGGGIGKIQGTGNAAEANSGGGGGGAQNHFIATTYNGGAGGTGFAFVIEFLGEAYGSGEQRYYYAKGSDETTNTDTTLSSDAELNFAVLANTTYRFRFVVFYDTPAAADFKYDITGPASPTLVSITTKSIAPGATSFVLTRNASFSFGPNSVTETSGTDGYVEIEGLVQNGANSGTVAFAWAQNTSNGSDTTVYKGSYVEYTPIS